MKRKTVLPRPKHRRFSFHPSFSAPRGILERYVADVCAVVFGCGITRRQARRLAFRLLMSTGECEALMPCPPFRNEVRNELSCLANAYRLMGFR